MEITLLVKSFIGLVTLLAFLIFFLFYAPRKKRAEALQLEAKNKKVHKKIVDFASLVKIVRTNTSTSQELTNALDAILEHYGEIDTITPYGIILVRICKHPNTTKDIILNFNRALERKNPRYAKEINSFIAQGLNSR